MNDTLSPWWAKDRHADRRPFLKARADIAKAVRGWFDARGFTEVETGAVVSSPGNEIHLHALSTTLTGSDGAASKAYLRTSPEFACKKLLAAGERRIFELAKVWRDREAGPLHAPEFTLLEWYRAERPYTVLMDDCADLLKLAAATAQNERWSFRGRECDPNAPPERLTLAQAFETFADIDLMATLGPWGAADRDALAAAAEGKGVRVAQDDGWSDVFSRVLTERIEPNLGVEKPTILYEYPAPEAALARRSPTDPRVAERFELYACGVELANGFGELTDPVEQRARFTADMDEKERLYGERHPLDEELLAALAEAPQACGVALGFDRLAMLACGATHIDQVIWSPAPGRG